MRHSVIVYYNSIEPSATLQSSEETLRNWLENKKAEKVRKLKEKEL